MSKGGGSQTQSVKPPSYAMPYLQTGLNAALGQYNGGAMSPGALSSGTITDRMRAFTGGGKSGATGASPSGPINLNGGVNVNPYQVTGNQMTLDRATGGSPVINSATDYVTNTLNGDFLGANPYADAMFEKMRLATQGGLASEFGRSGRNVDQSQGLRAQQLGDMATSFYGGLYDNERNRQQGALGYAQPLGNQGYADAAAVGGLQTPEGTALDDYLRRINSSIYGSSSSAGNSGFSGGGALGGALTGAQLAGPWGALAGGVLGGFF